MLAIFRNLLFFILFASLVFGLSEATTHSNFSTELVNEKSSDETQLVFEEELSFPIIDFESSREPFASRFNFRVRFIKTYLFAFSFLFLEIAQKFEIKNSCFFGRFNILLKYYLNPSFQPIHPRAPPFIKFI